MQRRFTKRIAGMNNLEYEQRLMVLKLPSLEQQEVMWLKLLKLCMVFNFMILKLFLVQAEQFCWNMKTPFQTTQEDSSY